MAEDKYVDFIIHTTGWTIFPLEMAIVFAVIVYFYYKAKKIPVFAENGSSSIVVITITSAILGNLVWGILGILLDVSCLNIAIMTYLCFMIMATILVERAVVVYFQFYLVERVQGLAKTRFAYEGRVVRELTREGNIRISIVPEANKVSPREIWLDDNSNTTCLDKFLLRYRSYLSSRSLFSIPKIFALILSFVFSWFAVYEFLIDTAGEMPFKNDLCQLMIYKSVKTVLACFWIAIIICLILNLFLLKRLRNHFMQRFISWSVWLILTSWCILISALNYHSDDLNASLFHNIDEFWTSYIISGIFTPIFLVFCSFAFFLLKKKRIIDDSNSSNTFQEPSVLVQPNQKDPRPEQNASKIELLNRSLPVEKEMSRTKNSKTEFSRFSSSDLKESFLDALSNAKIRHEFEFFLMSELSIENLILYDALVLFLRDFSILEEENVSEITKDILELSYEVAYKVYIDFMREDSPFNINIAHERRNQFMVFFTKKIYGKDMKSLYDMMKNLLWDIETLMKNDSFARFRSSPQYSQIIAEIESHDYEK